MNDLISRSALLDRLTTERFAHYHTLHTDTASLVQHNQEFDVCMGIVFDFPAVDAVEVVRCVNCVWYCEWRTKPGVFICGRPNNGGLVVKPDFFCKHGEQKEDDNGKDN